MIRLVLLLVAVACVAAPFVVNSLYIDSHGIVIPGTVYSKYENVSVHYSSWTRINEVTITYHEPESGTVSTLLTRVSPEQYDAFHLKQNVPLHYLLERDAPRLPLTHALREMHLLPRVRLANQTASSAWNNQVTPSLNRKIILFLAVALILWLWRLSRLPGWAWATGAVVAFAIGWSFFSDFPHPTPPPRVQVQQATGRVKTIDQITHLFRTNRDRGIDTNQPIDVVGVEFIPARQTESVLAVDLIDSGSHPGLAPGATVALNYEASNPRIAHLQKGTRTFLQSNFLGTIEYALIYLVLVAIFWFAIPAAWRFFLRLIRN
jgi:hypothetical protein